jgi:hypothetical protein
MPPNSERPRARQSHGTKSQTSRTQKQIGLISDETQAALFVLLPIVVLVAILAFAGVRQ